MKNPHLALALGVIAFGAMAFAGAAEAGPIKRACLAADRAAASRELCTCIERVAKPMFSRSEMRRIAKFFAEPQLSQELRQSDRRADQRFWEQYKAWGAAARARCG